MPVLGRKAYRQTASKTVARPWPTPTHMVAMPYLAAAAAQLADEGGGEAGAGAAEGVAEGDRAAVDVELLLVDAELAGAGEDLGGEGLVELDQVDVVEA